jgi:hypothetical protein
MATRLCGYQDGWRAVMKTEKPARRIRQQPAAPLSARAKRADQQPHIESAHQKARKRPEKAHKVVIKDYTLCKTMS